MTAKKISIYKLKDVKSFTAAENGQEKLVMTTVKQPSTIQYNIKVPKSVDIKVVKLDHNATCLNRLISYLYCTKDVKTNKCTVALALLSYEDHIKAHSFNLANEDLLRRSLFVRPGPGSVFTQSQPSANFKNESMKTSHIKALGYGLEYTVLTDMVKGYDLWSALYQKDCPIENIIGLHVSGYGYGGHLEKRPFLVLKNIKDARVACAPYVCLSTTDRFSMWFEFSDSIVELAS